jgi:hypothetical protein
MVRVDRDGVGTKPTRYADMGRYRQFTLDGTEVRIGYEPALASAAPASDFPEFTAPTGVTAAAGQDVAGEESTTTGRSAPEAGTVAPAQTAVGQSVTAAPIGAAAAVGVAAPVADNPEAKQCLALEARPEPFGVAGCLKYVYLRNSCSRPVVVEVHKTQHLSSGALSERVTIVATAGGEQRFACAWSRGATAPSEFILLNAEFLTTATHAGIGAEHGPAPGR